MADEADRRTEISARLMQLAKERDDYKQIAERLAIHRERLEGERDQLREVLDTEREEWRVEKQNLLKENQRFKATLERISGHAIDWASEVAKRGLKE